MFVCLVFSALTIYFKIIKIVTPRNHKGKVVLIMQARFVYLSEKKKGSVISEELKSTYFY